VLSGSQKEGFQKVIKAFDMIFSRSIIIIYIENILGRLFQYYSALNKKGVVRKKKDFTEII